MRMVQDGVYSQRDSEALDQVPEAASARATCSTGAQAKTLDRMGADGEVLRGRAPQDGRV